MTTSTPVQVEEAGEEGYKLASTERRSQFDRDGYTGSETDAGVG
jgi:hypothetical protein